MLDDIRRLWQRLRPDPAKTSLGRWVAAAHITIVLIVGGGISLTAVDMLRDLADQQGMARVQLAGAMAREDLRRLVEDTVTSARVLSERPTLSRLLVEGRADDLQPFLRRFCQTEAIDACAVFDGGALVATAGPALPWDEIQAASAEQGEGFLVALPDPSPAALGGVTTVSGGQARVFTIRMLDQGLARDLSRHVGLDVHIVSYRTYTSVPVNDFTRLHSAALADGRSAVQRVRSQELYASSFPVFASTGEAIALIETRLPAAELDTATSRFVRRLLLIALILAGFAALAGVIISRVVAGPVKALTDAAARLGQGDFSTSIPHRGAAEVGVLARTMEHMRRNLVELTGTLRRREAEARAVLGGIVEGVYAVDKDRVIRYLNPQAARLLGIDEHGAVGRFCGDVLNPLPTETGRRPCEDRCPIVQARRGGSAQALERLQLGERDPRTTIITSSDPVEGLQVQVIRDETELEAVRRARDSVLANISHEFRTPLAAQLASIELLREGLATMPQAQQAELVTSLERGTLRLTQLIDNLLESVRIESGQLNIRRQSVGLADVVEDAHSLIGALLRLRRQTLEVAIPDDLPFIHGDGPRLTQVFVNLIANASKFAPEGSTVRIGARGQGSRVVAWVEDEGPGVPGGDGATIFERFRRGPHEEPEPGGLGLGLWIVKSIIDRHGGTIDITRTVEQRTRFTLDLPAEAGE